MLVAMLSLLALEPAQTPGSTTTVASVSEAEEVEREPDLMISVGARADQVTWRQVGSVTVRAWSEPNGGVIEENLTTGLPRPIPGQRTFRDVEWNLLAGACVDPAQLMVESSRSDPDRRCDRPVRTNTQTGDSNR